jgi:cyclopropane-fatty-acyl-phospholipid synthase
VEGTIIPAESGFSPTLLAGPLDRLARRVVFALLKGLVHGSLILIEKAKTYPFGKPSAAADLTATVTIHHPGVYRLVLFSGSRGLGEAYVAGWWEADDLTVFLRLLVRNLPRLERLFLSWTKLAGPFYDLVKWPFRNTLQGSRTNIYAHYDLGNDFYALFLDETMTYSCGIFEHEDSTLKEASLAKYDRICRKLNLTDADHVLEIGSGWGGFAIHAASRYGCRITTTTISPAQFHLARERVQAAGLADRVEVLLEDYRRLQGSYDKLVSIEMIEAVGFEYLDDFFWVCSERLQDNGLMCLQAITIADQVFDRYRRSLDFIRSHVFPGSCLTSMAAMTASLARATDLRLIHLEDITSHYVKTLRHWRERFLAQVDQVGALGYPESFVRLWKFYLCYCEAGFAERYTGDVQMLLAKPKFR